MIFCYSQGVIWGLGWGWDRVYALGRNACQAALSREGFECGVSFLSIFLGFRFLDICLEFVILGLVG